MARNAEVVRQWNILREIEASRRATIPALARMSGVSTRTIRRDLEALQEAGFPLFDDKEHGTTWWKLGGEPFKSLAETGFTLAELCALYFSRQVLDGLAGTPFQADLRKAFVKFEQALGPRMRSFLDRMPGVIAVKPGPAARTDGVAPETVARLLDASFNQRQISMAYHSLSSERVKEYDADPYRVIYAEGGLYLLAYVHQYREIRTFAVERIRRLTVRDTRFDRNPDAPSEVFASSLGVHSGPPEPVSLEFAPSIAPYVRNRVWHPSQRTREKPDGTVAMDLDVCHDRSLRTWILSFGPLARVIAPEALAAQIVGDLDAARARYPAAASPALPAKGRPRRTRSA